MELLHAMAGGDNDALVKLYHRYWQRLFMAAYNILKDKAPCEDMVQEIFLQLWQRRETLEVHTSVEAYLFSIIRYKVFYHIKKERVRAGLFDQLTGRLYNATPEDIATEKNILKEVAHVVEALPDKCRQVYRLSREEQLSHREIAERLNISTKTVENQLTIALRKIRFTMARITIFIFLIS
jgi:RNA polymerase sigma-70 factor (ECF subfamily)